jgi:hypothetical protein
VVRFGISAGASANVHVTDRVPGMTLLYQRMGLQLKTVLVGIKVPFSELSEPGNFIPHSRLSEHIREGVGG